MTTRDRDLDNLRKTLTTVDLSEVSENVQCISTGVISFDLAMGGGWPESRISELGGMWQTGKSLIAYQSIRECQKSGGIAFLDDAERAFDKRWARIIGVNLDDLFLYNSTSLEDGFEHLEKACTAVRESPSFANCPVLYVKDSLEASIAMDEIKKSLTETGGVALRARSISRGLRRLTNLIADQRMSVLFINQLRTKIGVMFGDPDETSGGKAPKYYSGMRVALRPGGKIKVDEKVVGFKCSFEVIKSKIGVPFKKVHFELMLNRGIHSMSGLLPYLLSEGVITKPTTKSYQFGDVRFPSTDFPKVWEEKKVEIVVALKILNEAPMEDVVAEESEDG